jgi:alcohol dehydrogenase (NADP+)
MKTWRKMEELVDMGLVRHIGTSNMTIPKLKLVLRDARIKPAVNEMELHPHFQQPSCFRFVLDNGMQPVGYCPIGSPGRPERDRTPEDTAPTEDPVIARIAARHGFIPRWCASSGRCSAGKRRFHFPFIIIAPILQGVVGDPLTDEEMRSIAAIDCNCRLIKGQVFLWKEGQTWEDLWDVSGEITPP